MKNSVFLSNLHYFFAKTDGSYDIPNTADGDLLKQAKKELEFFHSRLCKHCIQYDSHSLVVEGSSSFYCPLCRSSFEKYEYKFRETD